MKPETTFKRTTNYELNTDAKNCFIFFSFCRDVLRKGTRRCSPNWLGFEGNNLEAVIDLEQPTEFNRISTAFLQVTNHLVFFPNSVEYYYSMDGQNYQLISRLTNQSPLTKESKINDIQYFSHESEELQARYLKIIAKSAQVAPEWHHGSGLPSWIFIDELEVR